MTVGDNSMWSDVFPDELVPDIVDLVWETWREHAPKPTPRDLEVPITRKFKHALKQAKDYRRLPVRIEREPAEDDPVTGEELGRIDIKLCPAGSAVEEVHFAFECKRLNAHDKDGKRATLAPEYVKEGMMRFVRGQYSGKMRHGGMIGYVLDGQDDNAIRLVKSNVEGNAADLKLHAGTSLDVSALRPDIDRIRQTVHGLEGRVFQMHHLFLNCPSCEIGTAPGVNGLPSRGGA
jgi:hypothetical protein